MPFYVNGLGSAFDVVAGVAGIVADLAVFITDTAAGVAGFLL
jgi:hypothetical protein